ncbi:hypothetical protein [uncultured Piscinibacter sp.]|uniref:hypothetical protein n=1 Tax=uncultured Piscinibacter sp. TaxID=1131835 RepID=UPI002619AEC6|nr:hypothetical protein [uncultured Piscinibacter sp.]
MNDCTMSSTIPLHRGWRARVRDGLADAQAWLQGVVARWRAQRRMQDALDLDEATLRDMGMPLWMQEEARARREQRERGLSPDRLGARGGLGRFY